MIKFSCLFGHKPFFTRANQPEADGNGGAVLWTHCERCGKRLEYRASDLWSLWRDKTS